MKTYSVKYTTADGPKTIIVNGDDLNKALKKAGFADPAAFIWNLMITYKEITL